MSLDLDAILATADAYEARKKAMTEAGALKDPAYLATLAEGEAAKAFEALRPLVERVRELERQRDWLAKKCEDLSDYLVDFFMPYSIPAETWIERAEQAAKEAE